jgi:hypothetical protein
MEEVVKRVKMMEMDGGQHNIILFAASTSQQ